MKTIFYLTAILVIGIQGILISQEKNNQSVETPSKSTLKPINKLNYDTKKDNSIRSNATSSVIDKSTNEASKRINLIDRQIAELEKLKSSLQENEPAVVMAKNSSTTTQQLRIVKIDQYFAVKEESDALNAKYESLRKAATVAKQNNEKLKLLNQANEVYKVYEIKEIKASNALAQINLEKFTENKTIISTLLIDYKGGAIYVKLVNKLTDEADFAMRMAIEIREEANAQPNNSAILANYSNAEEKEVVALNKQEEAVDILQKTAYFSIYNTLEGYAFNGNK